MYPIRTRQAYRRGQDYSFEPGNLGEWEPVMLELAPGTRVEWSGTGVRMLYHGDIPFGVGIGAALQLGWCSLTDNSAGK